MYKKILFIPFLLVSSISFAQEQQKTFTFNITESELQVVATGLEALPFKQAAPIIQKLQQQIQAQIKPVNLPPLPTPKPEEAKPEEKK